MQRVLFAIVATVGVTQAQSPLMMGSGSSLLAPLFRNWHESYNNLPGKRAFRYDSTGSGTGVKRVLRNESHWIGSEATLTDADYAMYPGIQMLPIAISPIAIMFNVVGTDGSPILGLRLDRGTLARIYSFDVTYWDDARIQALNPAVLLPHNVIRPVVRADSSGTSVIMSSSLVSFGWADTAGCGVEGAGCEVTKKLHQVSPGPRNASGHPLHAYESASGSSGVTDFVKHNANTIGYVGVATAIDNRVSFAVMVNKLGVPTLANRDAAQLSAAGARYEPVRLTADVHDQEGYPVLGMAYLAYWRDFEPLQQFAGVEPEYRGLTKDYKVEYDKGEGGSMRGKNWGFPADYRLHDPGKTCEEHAQLLDYLYWLYTSDEATAVIVSGGLVPVPQSSSNRVLGQLWRSSCAGTRSWARTPLIQVEATDEQVQSTLHSLGFVYHQATKAGVVHPSDSTGGSILAHRAGGTFSKPANYLSIPLVADGLVLVYNAGLDGLRVPLELSVETIRKILSGEISQWNDPVIAQRNTFAPLPVEPIRLAVHKTLLRNLLVVVGHASLGVDVQLSRPLDGLDAFASEAEVAAYVNARTGVLGVLSLTTARKWPLSQVYLVTTVGETEGVVTPSVEAIESALAEAQWAENLESVRFVGSLTAYQLVSVTWLHVPAHFTGNASVGQTAYDAAKWLSGAEPYRTAATLNGAAAAMAELGYAAPVRVPFVQTRIDEFFRSLTVNGRKAYDAPSSSTSVTWLWFLLGGIGVLAILGAGFAGKSYRDARRIQRLLDINTIAEKSAVAIAEMRLEEMEYLRDTPDPNTIQLAFIKIMDVLKEYRTYLPQSIAESGSEEVTAPAPVGNVTLVFTDIQSSTALWEEACDGMEEALNHHNKVLRKNIKRYEGYEVKTIGDAFMVAFQDTAKAVNFCLESQMDLLNAPRPAEFDDIALTRGEVDEKGVLIWSGLRVRMGVNCGPAPHEVNPVTGRMDYRGPVVNKAARFESNGVGGCVTVSQEVHVQLQKDMRTLGKVFWTHTGSVSMKGIPEPQEMFLYLPSPLAERAKGSSASVRTAPSSRSAARRSLGSRQSKHSKMDSVGSPDIAPSKDPTRSERSVALRAAAKKELQVSLQLKEVTSVRAELRMAADASEKQPCSSALLKYNSLISCTTELLRRTGGLLQSMEGSGAHCTWNCSSVCATHLQQGLRFTQLLADRSPVFDERGFPLVQGLSSGKALVGNVGSAARRSSVVGGRTVHLSSALCTHAWSIGADALAVVHPCCPQFVSALRLVDVWGTFDHATVLVYQIDVTYVRELDSCDIWSSSDTDPGSFSSPNFEHDTLILKAVSGDVDALTSLRRTSESDPVLAHVVQLLSLHVQDPKSNEYRALVPGPDTASTDYVSRTYPGPTSPIAASTSLTITSN
eukprot:TRINITY_DN731_c0_g1_i1.p1 TRINITY_DN731_c0_g1~~TRINITY_DN731_c0_g1_i1.p1  ORF type:complete len:1642 (+),score=233.15 TRINITY_DN731_c0_g1_i1:725-4927(+)